MQRIKLFCFYQMMAFMSVVRPAEGVKMIDAAEAGVAARRRSDQIRHMHRNGAAPQREEEEEGSGVALCFLALLVLVLSLGWLALLGYWVYRVLS